MTRALIGCSGWNYRHWRELFYPRGLPASRWLRHYAARFDSVEVNATFYRLPTRKAAAGWVDSTPPGFVFAIKASRYLTHVKRLREVADGAARLLERLEPIVEAGRLGPILWQLPETFQRDDSRLLRALEALPEGRHCFEFRHESWFCPEIEQLLREHRAALVIGDHPQRRFQSLARTTDWVYLRFHRGRGRNGNYTGSQLETWSDRVREWLSHGDVYAYFNDDWGGHAIAEAIRLRELLAEQ